MVAMSPEAVTDRLRLMDELWELSVKLMNSTQVPQNESTDRADCSAAVDIAREGAFQFQWIAGDGGPLIVMEAGLLDFWEGSDAPSEGRIVKADSRWGLDVATDYDLACDLRELAGVISMARGHALVLSTEHAMATWLSPAVDFAGALIEWEYADAENEVVEAAKALIREGNFSQAAEFCVKSSPLVLFVAAERGHDDACGRLVFDLAPGQYTVRTGRRVTDKTSVVCHIFESKPTKL